MRKVSSKTVNDSHPIDAGIYKGIIILKSKAGVPMLCAGEVIDPKTIKPDPVFLKIFGSPCSQIGYDNLYRVPERKYLLYHTLSALQSLTSFTILVTSHDQSRDGTKRKNSVGHSSGAATDIVFMLNSGTEDEPEYHIILDLMNSVSFLSYLEKAASLIFPFMQATGKSWLDRNLILGCEFDHVHIEWPWSSRALPSRQGFMRMPNIPSGISIGTFYNPQATYGMPTQRAGVLDNVLFML